MGSIYQLMSPLVLWCTFITCFALLFGALPAVPSYTYTPLPHLELNMRCFTTSESRYCLWDITQFSVSLNYPVIWFGKLTANTRWGFRAQQGVLSPLCFLLSCDLTANVILLVLWACTLLFQNIVGHRDDLLLKLGGWLLEKPLWTLAFHTPMGSSQVWSTALYSPVLLSTERNYQEVTSFFTTDHDISTFLSTDAD